MEFRSFPEKEFGIELSLFWPKGIGFELIPFFKGIDTRLLNMELAFHAGHWASVLSSYKIMREPFFFFLALPAVVSLCGLGA